MGSPQPRLAGLILAGGRSSRFGAEKAVQLLRGRTLMEWSLAALGEVADPIALSASTGDAATLARPLGLTVLPDRSGDPSGPLAGVAAGLAWARRLGAERLVTLPCDTPMVTGGHLARLTAFDAAYAVTADGLHPLCAVWPVTLLDYLGARLAAGIHPAVRVAHQEARATAVMFEDAAAFANVNTPLDLAALEAR